MMTEHMDVHSPDRMPTLKPRVLRFAVSPENSLPSTSSAHCQAAAPTSVVRPQRAVHQSATKGAATATTSSISIATMGDSRGKQTTASSPPYRKVRALRLFDTPTTPKTIIQKSSLAKLSAAKTSAFAMGGNKQPNDSELRLFCRLRSSTGSTGSSSSSAASAPIAQLPTPALHPKTFTEQLATSGSLSNGQHDRPTALHVHNKALDSVYANVANVNPFSPNSMAMRNKKRSRTTSQRDSCTESSRSDSHSHSTNLVSRRTVASLFSNYAPDAQPPSDCETVQAPKRLALQDSNISRYEKEFLELSRIGVGEFGYVYHCLNRLDGCDYAIKKSIKPVAGSVFEKTALNEVWAHAVLGKHDNVVRYYSAWAENNHMLIQNEYCNGGSLQNVLSSGRILAEQELRTLLLHIASGLKYIHSNDLVHMDLKAGNIFLSRLALSPGAGAVNSRRGSSSSGGLRASTSSAEYCDDGFEDDQAADSGASAAGTAVVDQVTYKIGDLGHVTSVNDPQVEEGDCRYLPAEILSEDFTHLCQADIFALGITLYEAGGGGALPKNGDRWHELRNGNVPDLPRLSREFNDLIKRMTHPDPTKRPTSTTIFDDPVLYSVESKSKAQLMLELELQRQKYDQLMKKLRESQQVIKSYEMNGTPNGKKSSSSPSMANSDRKLRSYSRKTNALSRQRTARGIGARSNTLNSNVGYRDPNKVGEINFFL